MNSLSRPGRRIFMLATGACGIVLACTETQLTRPIRPTTPSHSEFADSSGIACQDWNCRSLEPWEEEELADAAERGRLNAIAFGDYDCYQLYGRTLDWLNRGKIYVARRASAQAPPGAVAGYNQSPPNEIYIMETRWASAPAAVNSANHESEHGRRGKRPADRGYDSWENEVQSVADGCQFYAEF